MSETILINIEFIIFVIKISIINVNIKLINNENRNIDT